MRTVDILIVGGGAAGIAAARRLAGAPLDVLLVEAAPRLGGRANTVAAGGWPLDLGCGWLHSAERNAWASLAEADGIAIDRTPPAWQRQWQDIGFTAAEQAAAGAASDRFEQRLRADPPGDDVAASALAPDEPWNAYLQAISGYINGADLAHLSVADYLAYEDHAGADNWRLPSGYGAMIAAAGAGLPVMTDTRVEAIDRRGSPLVAITDRGRIEAQAVIVTVSTAVLAAERLRFDPPLPALVEAAAALPLGLADKAFLALDRPEPFEPDTQLIGNPRDPGTGAYYLRPFGRPLVECFFGGAGAAALEREGPGAAGDFAIAQLVSLLGSDMRRRLTPLVETRWGADPLVGGSYSHARPGQASARAALARPIEDRIFIAGEAASPHDFSTAHGAHDSGVAAAEAALAALSPRSRMPGSRGP